MESSEVVVVTFSGAVHLIDSFEHVDNTQITV